jgi:hypothetical protein
MAALTEHLFEVTGHKRASLLLTEDSLQFSSNSFPNAAAFEAEWTKKMTLATKVEIKYDAIKSVVKEDDDDDICIKFRGLLGVPQECEFAFKDSNDVEVLFDFLENQQNMERIEERLTPFRAALPFFLVALLFGGGTYFAHLEAVALANGTSLADTNYKARFFSMIINVIGDTGVWLIGGAFVAFFLLVSYLRFSSPPDQTRFIPLDFKNIQ